MRLIFNINLQNYADSLRMLVLNAIEIILWQVHKGRAAFESLIYHTATD